MANDNDTLENTQPYKSPRRIIGEARSALVALDAKEPGFPALQKAVDLADGYTILGDPDDILKAFRAAEILDGYIKAQPKPVQDAWIAHLREKKAL